MYRLKLKWCVYLIIIPCYFIMSQVVRAQENPVVAFSPEKGLTVVSADEFMSFNLGMLLQHQVYASAPLQDTNPLEASLMIRRVRIQLDGNIFHKKLGYLILLGMDRGNVRLLNAEYRWRPNSNTNINVGQLRAPAGRQFQTISKNLQMVDRSPVSRVLGIDFDIGVTASTYMDIGKTAGVIVYGGITQGDGINSAKQPGGLAYTARVDVLPFGKFNNKGDYVESDLYREPTPKLSIGLAHHFNHDAASRMGDIAWQNNTANIYNYYIDGVFKYDGFSFLAEYLKRDITNDGILITPTNSIIYSKVVGGWGLSAQMGKFITKELEPTVRVSFLNPDDDIRIAKNEFIEQQKYGVGLNYFFIGHSIKIQSEMNLVTEKYAASGSYSYVEFSAQFSLGF